MTRLMPGDDTLSRRAAPPTVAVTMIARMTSICRNVSIRRSWRVGTRTQAQRHFFRSEALSLIGRYARGRLDVDERVFGAGAVPVHRMAMVQRRGGAGLAAVLCLHCELAGGAAAGPFGG